MSQESITGIKTFYWAPDPQNLAYVKECARGKNRILEVGPGPQPFEVATEYIDWQQWTKLSNKIIHCVDLNSQPLPYADKSIDFIYCRHVFEDLYNPFWLCQEMIRVAKAGYIETPSPLAECTRGIDFASPPWRGYIHHRYLVWKDGENLCFLSKYPVIEYVDFGENETEFVELLNSGPLHWDTYFYWKSSFQIQLLQHDQDFKVQENYIDMINQAIETSFLEALDWQKTIAHRNSNGAQE